MMFSKLVLLALFVSNASGHLVTEQEQVQGTAEVMDNKKNFIRGAKNAAPGPEDTEDAIVDTISNDHRALGRLDYAEELSIYDGIWGDWKDWASSDPGFYACGARIRYENSCGGCDDTAANGLHLVFCHFDNWNNQKTVSVWDGNWGSWKDTVKCSPGKYIVGAEIRFEDKQGGGDDTALNGMRIRCATKTGGSHETKTVWEGNWGSWKGMKSNGNKFVAGARVRYEDSCGSCDDTAWNGLRFMVETPNNGYSQATVTGEWINIRSAAGSDGLTYKITTGIETTDSHSVSTTHQASISTTIEGGFQFKAFSASASITASYAYEVSKQVQSTITRTRVEEVSFTCPASRPVVFQWRMDQPEQNGMPGFKLMSDHYRCQPSTYKRPKCPLGFCSESNDCQTCENGISPM